MPGSISPEFGFEVTPPKLKKPVPPITHLSPDEIVRELSRGSQSDREVSIIHPVWLIKRAVSELPSPRQALQQMRKVFASSDAMF